MNHHFKKQELAILNIKIGEIPTEGSSDMIRTVLSAKPTAKNHERCSPAGTVPRAMHITSEGIFRRSVYSLS